MKHYQFRITNPDMVASAMEELADVGLAHLYTIESPEEGSCILGGFGKAHLPIPPHLPLLSEEDASIDWESHWQRFSPFATLEGRIECSLETFGGPTQTLKLLPGEGFGDLSHPTTKLMLRLIANAHPTSFVVDIGCGSGVLACAAALMGAEKVYAYDIDALAVRHTEKNALYNGVQEQVKAGSEPLPCIEDGTILINMTLGELKEAIAAFRHRRNRWIISGIHRENKADFLALAKRWHFSITEEVVSEDWLGYIVKENEPG